MTPEQLAFALFPLVMVICHIILAYILSLLGEKGMTRALLNLSCSWAIIQLLSIGSRLDLRWYIGYLIFEVIVMVPLYIYQLRSRVTK